MSTQPKIRLKVRRPSRRRPGHEHEPGAEGVAVECLGANIWLVEVRVPDDSLESDAWYETLELRGHEFELVAGGEVVKPASPRPLVARDTLPEPWLGGFGDTTLPPIPEAEKLAS